jgi:hypothetical protein
MSPVPGWIARLCVTLAVAEPAAKVVVPNSEVKSIFGRAVPGTVVYPTVSGAVTSPVRVTVKIIFAVPPGAGSMALASAMDSVVAGARPSSSSSTSSNLGRRSVVLRLTFEADAFQHFHHGRTENGVATCESPVDLCELQARLDRMALQ